MFWWQTEAGTEDPVAMILKTTGKGGSVRLQESFQLCPAAGSICAFIFADAAFRHSLTDP